MNLTFEQIFVIVFVVFLIWSLQGFILYECLKDEVNRPLQKAVLYFLSGPVVWIALTLVVIVERVIILPLTPLTKRFHNWFKQK